MSNCRSLCIKCSSAQSSKVNLIKIHGACSSHMENLSEFEYCIHCKSTLPVILSSFNNKDEKIIKNLSQDSKIFTISTFSDSTTSMIPEQDHCCDYCTKFSEICSFSCHKICKSCYFESKSCPICSMEMTTKSVSCDYCKEVLNVSQKPCGHQLCANCSKESCLLCQLISRPDSVFSSAGACCEYCGQTSRLSSCPDSRHELCSSCLAEGCGLCMSYSTPRNRCQACLIRVIKETCVRGHSLCDTCIENCVLCNPDLSMTRDSFIVNLRGSLAYRGQVQPDVRKNQSNSKGTLKELVHTKEKKNMEDANSDTEKDSEDIPTSFRPTRNLKKKRADKGEVACNNCLNF